MLLVEIMEKETHNKVVMINSQSDMNMIHFKITKKVELNNRNAN